MTTASSAIGDETFRRLGDLFPAEEIVEIAAVAGLFNYFNLFNNALSVTPTEPSPYLE